jgi:hypothetical protein
MSAVEWRQVGRQRQGGAGVIVVEAIVYPPQESGDTSSPVALPVTIIVDEEHLWPIRVEGFGETTEFDTTEIVERDTLPDDFFSRDAVREMHITVDEQISQAKELGFTIYWLGERDTSLGVELREVEVRDGSYRVVFSYWKDEGLITIQQGTETWEPRANATTGQEGTDAEILVRGAPATIIEVPPPKSQSLVFQIGETNVEIFTHATKLFGNRELLVNIAESLRPLE